MGVENQAVIQRTKNWIKEVVIDLNLCPFAAQPFQKKTIEYTIRNGNSLEQHLQQLADSFAKLDVTPGTETSLLIYPDAYQTFDNYLELLDFSNHLLDDLNYSGVYQIASFHPDYCFDGSDESDASNFSNRSPYPMLHLLREKSLETAITNHPDIERMPENNIKKLQDMGYEIMSDKLKNITR